MKIGTVGVLFAMVSVAASCGVPSDPARIEHARVDMPEAHRLVRDAIFGATPGMNPDVVTPVRERTPDGCFERLGFQVFEVTAGVRDGATFRVDRSGASLLFGGPGGFGLHTALVVDLDGDGREELVYAWSWGSGIHRTDVGCLRRGADGAWQQLGADVSYAGNLVLERAADGGLDAFTAEFHDDPAAGPRGARLGRVRLADGVLEVELDRLPEEIDRRVWRHGR
ncbi:MAG: hypothetical protein ACO4CT_03445 [Planctomycetota bacterium]